MNHHEVGSVGGGGEDGVLPRLSLKIQHSIKIVGPDRRHESPALHKLETHTLRLSVSSRKLHFLRKVIFILI